MPRYCFNVRKDSHTPSSVGVELDNVRAARLEAIRLMGDELRHKPDEFWTDQEWYIEVTDDRGLILFTMFSAALGSPATGSPGGAP